MHKLLQNKIFWFLISGILLLIYSVFFIQSFNEESILTKSVEKVQKNLLIQEELLKKQTDEFCKNMPVQNISTYYTAHTTPKNLNSSENSFYVYNKDHILEYWSSNLFPIPSTYDSTLVKSPMVSLINGLYLCQVRKKNGNTIVGLSLVKHNFTYENEYLENSFSPSYDVDASIQLSFEKSNYSIFDTQKRFLFSLFIDEDRINLDYAVILSIIMLFLSCILLIMSVYWLIKLYIPSSNTLLFYFFLFLSVLILLIPLIIGGENLYPEFFYKSKLFSPIYFASSTYLPSLGYLFLDTLFLLFAFISLKKAYSVFIKPKFIVTWLRKLIILLLEIVQFSIFCLLLYVIKNIVFNSSISFSNDNIFNYTYLHFLIYGIFGILLYLFVYTTSFIVIKSYLLFTKKSFFWISYIFIFLLFTIVTYYYFLQYWHLLLYFVLYYLILALLIYFRISISKVGVKITLLLLFSFFLAQSIESFYHVKEHEERLLIAEKLGTQHDPITEYQLKEISTQLVKDQTVQMYAQAINKNEGMLIDYVNKTYLNTFASKYKISVTACKQNQTLKLQPDNYKIDCALYFDKKTQSVGTPTKVDNLWFMNYQPGQVSYLLIISINEGDGLSQTKLYIELDSKMLVTDSGYPELLIDNKQKGFSKDFSKYSYARYLNSDLMNQYGKYSYSIKLRNYKIDFSKSNYFYLEGYSHLYYHFSESESIIISKRTPSLLERSATVSFYFLLYGFLLLIISFLNYNPLRLFRNRISFRLRMQFYMITIILISFVLVGSVTINYFLELNKRKNIEFVNEKIHSIFTQFDSQLPKDSALSDITIATINQLVYQFSAQYFTDLNVYNAMGQIIATSRPQLYTQGLLKDKMNRAAIDEFKQSRKTLYFHDEMIGKQKYWSVYMPYFSSNGEVLMYINVPYFAKQRELNREISSFVVTFLSLYLFIILITIVIALLLARYISRPLLLIKERMSRIQLGDKNEKIAWKSTDEIGKLVEVYNNMVDELRISAELLAKSQREEAWREMAQQVAHEIKNPLTPMKLSVQMLERTYKKGDIYWEERLTQFSKTLVEQIDTLADIATSFSDFAKMPKGQFDKEDLLYIVNSMLLLHNYPSIAIVLETDYSKQYPVLVDKNQLIRVFNNLIKNAVQSIKATQQGKIIILLSSKDDKFWEIQIKDNGVGIPDAIKEKIFSPNFTTKNSGMGLGLAMVKNIIVDFGGEIGFTSEEGNGATFYFTIPKNHL